MHRRTSDARSGLAGSDPGQAGAHHAQRQGTALPAGSSQPAIPCASTQHGLGVGLHICRDVGEVRGWVGLAFTPYDRRNLENELRREFGDGFFGSSSIPTCIPSFDGRYGEPCIFKTAHHPDYKKDQHERLVNVGLSTAAAPAIFAAVKRNGYVFADGGI